MNILKALTYAPILRGFLILLIAGALFPLNGVFILRLNLITMRFMLMHGALLGGALALALGLNPLYFSLALSLVLVLIIALFSRKNGLSAGHITTFLMVLTVGLAFAIIYRYNVPAKDTLAILWGNLYALSGSDFLLTIGFSLVSLLFVVLLFRRIKAVLFNREIAFSSGINDGLIYNSILVLTGLTIAFCMKLIGALLLDALLLLPAIVASLFARSTRGLFFLAALFGFISSILGFFSSLALDIPASSGVTVCAALILGIGFLVQRTRRKTL